VTATAFTDHARARLAALAHRLPPPSPAADTTVRAATVAAAVTCPASACDDGEPFRWTAARARRAVVAAAIDTGYFATEGPLAAVREGVRTIRNEGRPSEDPRSLADWLASLRTVELDAVVAEALTLLHAMVHVVPALAAPGSTIRTNRITEKVTLSKEPRCAVSYRIDAVTRIERPERSAAALVVSDRPLGALADELSVTAVAHTLHRGPLQRITVVHPALRDRSRIDVGDDVLEAGLGHIEAALPVVFAHRAGIDPAPEVAGPACRTCFRRDRCATGQAWVTARTTTVDARNASAVRP
jgi:hypothetical protein